MALYSTSTVSHEEIDPLVVYAETRVLRRWWQLSPVGGWNQVTADATDQLRTHGPTYEPLAVDSDSLTYDAKRNKLSIPDLHSTPAHARPRLGL
ncbi:MAG: hypothetical protein GXP27_05130 [Planctomycetes bacterium]|nr:hypothetical protein [Planctomycetota bacterium]